MNINETLQAFMELPDAIVESIESLRIQLSAIRSACEAISHHVSNVVNDTMRKQLDDVFDNSVQTCPFCATSISARKPYKIERIEYNVGNALNVRIIAKVGTEQTVVKCCAEMAQHVDYEAFMRR